jgi:hypothetical protein
MPPTPSPQSARDELAALLPMRDAMARRAGSLRAQLAGAATARRERVGERALRCERLVALLDTRIRLAARALTDPHVSLPEVG